MSTAVKIYKNVLNNQTLTYLMKWVSDNELLFKDNGKGRKRLRLQDTNEIFNDFTEIEVKLKNLIKHDGLIPNHEFGDHGHIFLYQNEGVSTDKHIDDYHAGYKTVRINTTISAPEHGGRLVVSGVPIDATVGTTLVFYPSEVEHWSEEVIGKTPRIALSLAYCFPINKQLNA